eukprot:scaffold10109_cov57-Phaeocystis_antarctica.AAC.3
MQSVTQSQPCQPREAGGGELRHRQDDAFDMVWEPAPFLARHVAGLVGAALAALPLALRLRVAAPRAHVAKGAVRRAEGDEPAAVQSDHLAARVVRTEREDLRDGESPLSVTNTVSPPGAAGPIPPSENPPTGRVTRPSAFKGPIIPPSRSPWRHESIPPPPPKGSMTGVPPTGAAEEGDSQALLALELVATIAVEDSSQVRSGGPEPRTTARSSKLLKPAPRTVICVPPAVGPPSGHTLETWPAVR